MGYLFLSALYFWSQMVFGVALHNMLGQWAVRWQKRASDMNCFSVPDLRVFQSVSLRIQNSQEPQLSPNAEVARDNE
jgi:hypothetical protein